MGPEQPLFMQGDGVTTPGSGIQVSKATVRGVKSFGMICSAYDLGWMEEANGFAVELPQGMQPGDALEGTPLKVQLLSMSAMSINVIMIALSCRNVDQLCQVLVAWLSFYSLVFFV